MSAPRDVTVTTAPALEAEASVPALEALPLPARYEDLGRLAVGGFGELRRVYDRELDRVVAMKLQRADRRHAAALEARFLAEAKLTAGLEHPGIVSVHDRGTLPDGRLWFTMREVRGRTLGEVLEGVHAQREEEPTEWTFRRLLDAFARVCQAVAFAHRRGVVHRDLKPDNIMVGALGEVLVMDWGLGLRLGAAEEPEGLAQEGAADGAPAQLTRHGDVLGTPAYMPPEQARGERALHGLASDVYSLGAVLYHLLAGRPPYVGPSSAAVLAQVLAGPPVPVREAAARALPEELVAVCERAMQRERHERFADAEALARAVLDWLDGARRREQALALVLRAAELPPEFEALRDRAEKLRGEARAHSTALRLDDPVELKRPGWALEDEAESLEVRAALRETEWLEAVHGALSIEPGLEEAHAALAGHYRARLVEAERARRSADSARFEALLRTHDGGAHAAFLRGEGALTLVTEPAGAEVLLERYVLRDRCLVAEPVGVLGRTPLRAVTLTHGSYRLRLRAPGCEEVRYPVLLERGAHWDGCAPGESEPFCIALPPEGELSAEEVYVPAGWCWTGGDPDATDGLPARRVWIDGFVLGRHPVTCREWFAYVEALRGEGREEDARKALPRKQLGVPEGEEVSPLIATGPEGELLLPPDWTPEMPVALVDWYAATEYARWRAARSGRPWRLPNELEREKAARGVDARALPWGQQLDATFASVLEAQRGGISRAPVGVHPVDEGPYGARDLAGNMREWCANQWTPAGPTVSSGRLLLEPAGDERDTYRALRGGAWTSPMTNGRAAARFAGRPEMRWLVVSVRVARSYGGSAGERARPEGVSS